MRGKHRDTGEGPSTSALPVHAHLSRSGSRVSGGCLSGAQFLRVCRAVPSDTGLWISHASSAPWFSSFHEQRRCWKSSEQAEHGYRMFLSLLGAWWWAWVSRAHADIPMALEGTDPHKGSARWLMAALPFSEGNKILVLWGFFCFCFCSWQNALLCEAFFFTRTFIFAFFDEKTKLRALHFSIFFAEWAFQEW